MVADPIQIVAWMLPPPALIVAVAPFANVGQVPMTVGSIVGVVPPLPPLDPEELALASPAWPLDDPEPLPELLWKPELLPVPELPPDPELLCDPLEPEPLPLPDPPPEPPLLELPPPNGLFSPLDEVPPHAAKRPTPRTASKRKRRMA
jgi:hypothetical protein